MDQPHLLFPSTKDGHPGGLALCSGSKDPCGRGRKACSGASAAGLAPSVAVGQGRTANIAASIAA